MTGFLILAGNLSVLPADAQNQSSIKAVAFDAFPVFDPRPVFALAEELFPGQGKALGDEWRTRQFEYTWLRVSGGQYKDFWAVTEDALVYACDKLKLDLTEDKRRQLMGAYLTLKPWPDVLPALQALKASGIRMIFLSNMTGDMLNAGIDHSGLDQYFDRVISTDEARTYKPDPKAYQLGMDALGLKREEILFVAFAGWDASGAKWFGYPTFWVNRLQLPAERLDVTVDGQGNNLSDLVEFLKKNGSAIGPEGLL